MIRLLSAALALGMLSLPALSQTTTTPPATSAPPATKSVPGVTTSPSVTVPPAGAQGSLQQRWYTVQPGDMRTSRLIGASVRNAAGENIGDINEILLDKSGRVAAVVVGVGGFLGIGEREVAMSWDAIQVRMEGSGNPAITVNATRDELRSAPSLERTGPMPR